MRAAWSTFTRIPLRYTVVTVFCLVVVVLLAIGQEGLDAIVPAALATLVVGVVLFVPTRRHRRARRAKAAVATAAAASSPKSTPPAQTGARVRSPVMAGTIQNAFSAEPGWRAIFGDGADSTMSRLVGWAVTTNDAGGVEVVGLIVDPADPSRIVPAAGVVTPEGQPLTRYGFKGA